MKTRENYISPADRRRIYDSLADYKYYKGTTADDLRFLFRLMYWAGLRCNEALRITPDRIDLDDNTIYLGRTKTELHGRAIIPPQLARHVQPWIDSRWRRGIPDDAPVVRVGYRTILRYLKRAGADLDILPLRIKGNAPGQEKVHTHLMRKSIGKDMHSGTHGRPAKLAIIQRTYRHASIKTTSDYIDASHDEVYEYWRRDTDEPL